MRVRRCAVLWMEPRELAQFDLNDLLAGGTGVVSRLQWFAHAPHLPAPIGIDADAVAVLGETSPTDWMDANVMRQRFGAACVRKLLQAGLLIGSTKPWASQREAEARLASLHWHGLASVWHMASRWQGVDSAQGMIDAGVNSAEGLREKHGAPPAAVLERGGNDGRIGLPASVPDELDALLDARTTCRNFDPQAPLPLAMLSRMLIRTFGARGRMQAADEYDVIKRTSPSGGALHPTECYLVVQRVDGLLPGLYHYHLGAHALEPLPQPAGFDQAAFALTAVSGQHWFAEAPVLCVLAPRFSRNFWKYRNHPKAYRVCILDVGHLSQTLQLCATHEGLGSFVTAAINEVEIEHAFGLHGAIDGPLAVCGFGRRAQAMATYELDPNGRIWPLSKP
ncbi:MAG: putative peptide maturation dehydrogenase [Thermomonas sp.]|uniref:putative peptide maturation dehydrogenase n=1 Tax=Thermomonas sp. TaxID=1971895 RepID=UPI00261C3C4C|nr:putative peptide maturation dehydrogenase [Thermomonas sp.]MCC7095991.1 putative peptide maturation dehydrogenase [Thermomonas sp.]